jgi:hypothetical protein
MSILCTEWSEWPTSLNDIPFLVGCLALLVVVVTDLLLNRTVMVHTNRFLPLYEDGIHKPRVRLGGPSRCSRVQHRTRTRAQPYERSVLCSCKLQRRRVEKSLRVNVSV